MELWPSAPEFDTSDFKYQLCICLLAVDSFTDLLLHLLFQFLYGERLQLPVVVQISLWLRLDGAGRFLLLGGLIQVHLLRMKTQFLKRKYPPSRQQNDTNSLGSLYIEGLDIAGVEEFHLPANAVPAVLDLSVHARHLLCLEPVDLSQEVFVQRLLLLLLK